MKTISRHGERCLGVYGEVSAPGTVRTGDPVTFTPAHSSAVGASLGRLADRIKRNAVRTGNRLLPS